MLEILLDNESIKNREELEKVLNYLKGEKIDEDDLIKAVINSKTSNNLNYSKNKAMEYELNYDKATKELKFIIKENKKILKKKYKFNKTFYYNINSFNKNIVKVIRKEFDHNLQSKLFENVMPKESTINELYKEIKPEFKRIIKKIMGSVAAEKFFRDVYKKKEKYKYLKYHFNREEVQNKILDSIFFAPIFNRKDQAVTNPIDLTIIINSIPSRFLSELTSIYNRKILILGKLILVAIHEILGHYLRKYYSYLTGQSIGINTKDDNEIQTGEEGGWFVENKFVGIRTINALTLRNALVFFYWSKFIDYPLIKGDNFKIDKNILEIIINDNEDIFDFIKKNNEDNLDDEKITIDEYLDLITPAGRSGYSIIHCPGYYEDVIIDDD